MLNKKVSGRQWAMAHFAANFVSAALGMCADEIIRLLSFSPSDRFPEVLGSTTSNSRSQRPRLDINNGGLNNITVRHCLILVTARECLALRHGLAGGPGSGTEPSLGARWRVLTPVECFLRPNGVAMTCAGHCQLRWTHPRVMSSSDALSMK